MYLEAIFSFYVLLYHFVGHSFFGLIFFGSFSDIIKRNFSLTLTKLNFYVDMSVWLFVGKQYYRLIPILMAHRILLTKNLIYTAVTRAKKRVILVGQKRALFLAIHSGRKVKRNTCLAERILKYNQVFRQKALPQGATEQKLKKAG